MDAVMVTKSNVVAVMDNAGITHDMLISNSSADVCSLCGDRCNDECDKYGISGNEAFVGETRAGACILYRLYNIVNKAGFDDVLYVRDDMAKPIQVGEL